MNLAVFVEHHYTRPSQPIRDALAAAGADAVIMTDATNHYREPGHTRWRGNFYNYLRILQAAAAAPEPWSVILQDDVSVPPGLLRNIAHITAAAPEDAALLAFYVPQNALYARAVEYGYSVVETYQNFWIQCMAIRQEEAFELAEWAEIHIAGAWVERGDGGSDDDTLNLYSSVLRRAVRTIVPSLVQHEGINVSLMGTPARVGRYRRESRCYAPQFDARTVDWGRAFAHPLIDRTRIARTDPRYRRTVGLCAS